MSKKPKDGQKKPKNQQPKYKGVTIELEENAEDMFLEHILNVKPYQKDAENIVHDGRVRRTRDIVQQEIDLHGLTLDEAREKVKERALFWVQKYGRVRIKIITGKGLGSAGAIGILAKEMHSWTLRELRPLIESIEDSPSEAIIGGLPIRGHFHVTLKGKP